MRICLQSLHISDSVFFQFQFFLDNCRQMFYLSCYTRLIHMWMYILSYLHDKWVVCGVHIHVLWNMECSLNSCVYIYVPVRVLHIVCVITKKLQFISILFCSTLYIISCCVVLFMSSFVNDQRFLYCQRLTSKHSKSIKQQSSEQSYQQYFHNFCNHKFYLRGKNVYMCIVWILLSSFMYQVSQTTYT